MYDFLIPRSFPTCIDLFFLILNAGQGHAKLLEDSRLKMCNSENKWSCLKHLQSYHWLIGSIYLKSSISVKVSFHEIIKAMTLTSSGKLAHTRL